MKIALDIDGVLRDFTGRLIEVYKEDYPDHDVKPITTWWFEDSFPIGKKIYDYYKENGERIFRFAKPFSGAYEFVASLKESNHVFIITAQPENLSWATSGWVEEHLPKVDGLFFTNKKWLADFDILLDDSPDVMETVWASGKAGILYNQAWNVKHNYPRVYNYEQFARLYGRI
jgi:5'(3')-deoxyribonucleotidase